MWVQVPGAARDFSPSHLPVQTLLWCPAVQLFGHTEILHTLIGMGNTALAAAVPYPGKASWISCMGQGSIKKQKTKQKTWLHSDYYLYQLLLQTRHQSAMLPDHSSVFQTAHDVTMESGAGIAQWLECRTGRGFESLQERWENFLLQGQISVLTFISVLFNPHVTAVAHKRSRSFCQRCRWQVTAKHAYTLHILWMMWHGAWFYGVHITCTETAAVSCSTSHARAVSTPLWWIFKKRAKKS